MTVKCEIKCFMLYCGLSLLNRKSLAQDLSMLAIETKNTLSRGNANLRINPFCANDPHVFVRQMPSSHSCQHKEKPKLSNL